jgi:hypothetical protein
MIFFVVSRSIIFLYKKNYIFYFKELVSTPMRYGVSCMLKIEILLLEVFQQSAMQGQR